jgi:peptidoglycan/LPS O-acetylase OafA/YrhL
VVTSRYELLDAWRGVAALAVLGFHSVNTLVQPGASWITDALRFGWAGVYIFFPISGYCILAASHSAANAHVGSFLKRRWRRIFPTYWASILLIIVLTVGLAPFSRGSAEELLEPGVKWLSILTLTQTFFGLTGAINPVYWSLCYEEQFYLVIAATLLIALRRRRWALLALSVIAALACCYPTRLPLPKGLFLDQWLNFAVGLAVYGWFDERYGRRWSLAVFGLALTTAAVTMKLELGISIAAAILFIAFRRHDRFLSSSRVGTLLGSAGLISYSLYLTHAPIAGRVVNFSLRFLPDAPAYWPIVVGAAAVVAIAGAVLFHRLVEKRFQNPPVRASRRMAATALAVGEA